VIAGYIDKWARSQTTLRGWRVNDALKSQMKSEIQGLESRMDISDLFLYQSMCNSLRAFSNLVLGSFFKACGKEDVGFQERATWLSNRGTDGGEAYVIREAAMIILSEWR
jgi:hypothetical protein